MTGSVAASTGISATIRWALASPSQPAFMIRAGSTSPGFAGEAEQLADLLQAGLSLLEVAEGGPGAHRGHVGSLGSFLSCRKANAIS